MPDYSGDVNTAILALAEPIAILQATGSYWDTASQTRFPGTIITTNTQAAVIKTLKLNAGAEVVSVELKAYFSKVQLGAVVPQNGDILLHGTTRAVIDDVQSNVVFGYFRALAHSME